MFWFVIPLLSSATSQSAVLVFFFGCCCCLLAWLSSTRDLYSGVCTSCFSRSVAMDPGIILFKRIPFGPNSCANVLVNPTTAALLATYDSDPVDGMAQDMLPMLMTDADPAARRPGMRACVRKNWWRKFTFRLASQSAAVISIVGRRASLPVPAALLMRASTLGKSPRIL